MKDCNGFCSCASPDGHSLAYIPCRTWQLVLLVLVTVWIISVVVKPMRLHLSPSCLWSFHVCLHLARRDRQAHTLGELDPQTLWLLQNVAWGARWHSLRVWASLFPVVWSQSCGKQRKREAKINSCSIFYICPNCTVRNAVLPKVPSEYVPVWLSNGQHYYVAVVRLIMHLLYFPFFNLFFSLTSLDLFPPQWDIIMKTVLLPGLFF